MTIGRQPARRSLGEGESVRTPPGRLSSLHTLFFRSCAENPALCFHALPHSFNFYITPISPLFKSLRTLQANTGRRGPILIGRCSTLNFEPPCLPLSSFITSLTRTPGGNLGRSAKDFMGGVLNVGAKAPTPYSCSPLATSSMASELLQQPSGWEG